MKKGVKILLISLVAVGLGLLVWLGPVVYKFWREGFFDTTPPGEYQATLEENLTVTLTAIKGFGQSEGLLPAAETWMEDIHIRLITADLLPGEELNKLRDPRLEHPDPEVFGLSFNPVFSQIHPEDAEELADTVVVFTSGPTGWNSAADPDSISDPEGLGITFGGEIVELGGSRRALP